MHIALVVGTKKGVFIAESRDRQRFELRGPYCNHWPINHAIVTAEGTLYAAGGDAWFGPAVWKSPDLGETWTHSSEGLAYPKGETPISAAWSVAARGDSVYCGVSPAGLFASEDAGATWRELDALRTHPTREQWMPGGAGLIAHSIVLHPDDDAQAWIGISAAGVFHTGDGGQSFTPRNRGTRQDYAPEAQRYPEVGQCVHAIAMAAGRPDRLYQQNHCGMYRSDDGGREWTSIEAGLPSSFGFPVVAHPRDADSAWLLPLNGDTAGRYMPDASAAVWRTRDAGATWTALRAGLPQGNAYFGVLRQAFAGDSLDPAGLYFGSSSGALYASADEGEHWTPIAEHLPTVLSVHAHVIDG